MKGGSGGGTSSKVLGNVTVFRIPTEEDYQKALKRVGEMIDFASREKCIAYVERQYESKLINSKHSFNLKTIIDTLLPLPKKEAVIIDETLDEEIIHTFRNWKNSKIYR